MSLTAATRAETTKLFSTSIWWILALVLFAYVAFTAAVLGFIFAAAATGALPGNAPALPEDGLAAVLYSTGTSVAYVFPLLVGTLMVTAEFRHKTLTPTFLATPRRGRGLRIASSNPCAPAARRASACQLGPPKPSPPPPPWRSSAALGTSRPNA